MRLELTGRHLDITPAIRRLVAAKCAKLERVLNDSAVSAQIVLARERHRHCTEITLHARGEKFLHGVGDAGSWEASLGDAIERLAHQAVKLKDKRQARTRRSGKASAAAAIEAGPPEAPETAPAGPAAGRARPRMPRILRVSRQAIRSMSVAEAARAVDAHRDGIVVFLDTETAAINVLYRQQNGELTLVEIEL
jgi:putative sigma-54 modulation protein